MLDSRVEGHRNIAYHHGMDWTLICMMKHIQRLPQLPIKYINCSMVTPSYNYPVSFTISHLLWVSFLLYTGWEFSNFPVSRSYNKNPSVALSTTYWPCSWITAALPLYNSYQKAHSYRKNAHMALPMAWVHITFLSLPRRTILRGFLLSSSQKLGRNHIHLSIK